MAALLNRRGYLPLVLAAASLATLLLIESGQLRVQPPTTIPLSTSSSRVLQEPEVPSAPRILLLTYMRAGSTFTGELLTLNHEVNYLFEPLWIFQNVNQNTSAPDARMMVLKTVEMQSSASNFLTSLFRCDPLLISMVASYKVVNKVRFNYTTCKQSPMVTKLIRIRGNTVRRVLALNHGLKVIQLVRDPRATIVSRNEVGAVNSSAMFCNEVREDLALLDELKPFSPSRYTAVRYEDLVNNSTSLKEVRRLHRFMDVPFSDEWLSKYKEEHYVTGKVSTKNKFLTKKSDDFDPHRWKTVLSLKDIKMAENVCQDVMNRFNYPQFK